MNVKVLVVDDSASMRAIIGAVIQKMGGYEPILAETGEQGVELFQQHQIDLAVLDVELPGISGFETCRRLRTLRQDDWFPVIYLSAATSDEAIVEGLEAGGDAYVSKPINPVVLEAILNAMGRVGLMKSKLAEANRELGKLAHFDGLTQILNRRGFEESLDRLWRDAKRNKSDLSLALLDVDHFKPFNDNYGHLEGDDCLKRVAAAIDSSLLRPLDIAARYGGEEFVVVLPQTPLEGAKKVVQGVIENVKALGVEHKHSTTDQVVTISAGIASSTDMNSTEQMLIKADEALYRAKESGRGRFCV